MSDEEEEFSSPSFSSASSSDSEVEELNAMEEGTRWVPGHVEYMSQHPVSGGEGNEGTVYVGMAKHKGERVLGMVVPEENTCYIPYGGEAVAKDIYYVLSNPDNIELEWKAASAGEVPSGALKGGYTINNEPLYIGRISVGGVVPCGKVQPNHGVCYVPYQGGEYAHKNYEVLCTKNAES